MVLRRLSGKTENAAPVLTLVTQFGGGKTQGVQRDRCVAGCQPATGVSQWLHGGISSCLTSLQGLSKIFPCQ
jgi:hypothetical protein